MSKIEKRRGSRGRLEQSAGSCANAAKFHSHGGPRPAEGLLPVGRVSTHDFANTFDERSYSSFQLSSPFDEEMLEERLPSFAQTKSDRFFRFNMSGFRLAILAGIAGSLLFALMSDFGRRSAHADSIWPVFERMAFSLGLGIDQVVLTGHHYTPERDIFDALRLGSQRTFLSFNDQETLRRLEKLPWVKSASIVRMLPGQLEVRVVEREAYALWQHRGELHLIDVTGRVLSVTEKRFAPNLPLVSGEGAASEVASLMRLVGSSKIFHERFLKAVRVSKRRWSLHLTQGVRVLLPAEGAAFALAKLRSYPKLTELLKRPHTLLDLRVSGRVTVRSRKGDSKLFLVTTPGSHAEAGGVPG